MLNDSGFFPDYWLASHQINLRRMDRRVLTKYIKKVNTLEEPPTLYPGYYIRDIKVDRSNFIFGVDEYFLTKDLFSYMKNNCPFLLYRRYYLMSFLFKNILGRLAQKLSQEETEAYNRFLDYVFPGREGRFSY